MLLALGPLTKLPKWLKAALALSVVAFVAVATLVIARWPYTEARILAAIQAMTGSRVHVQRFEASFFPKPGCTLQGLRVERGGQRPLAYAERLHIGSSWLSVLTFRKGVRLVHAERLQVHIPTNFPPAIRTGSSSDLGEVVIRELVADGTIIDVARGDDKAARYAIHQLRLEDVGISERIAYSTVLDIPDPPGRLESSGIIGPFPSGDLFQTPVEGSFQLSGASLDKYKGVAGRIDGKGKFRGPFEAIRVTGTAAASQFEVNRSGHPVDLHATYAAVVNGRIGRVALEAVETDFLQTHLSVNGSLNSAHGTLASLRFVGDRARVEDLLSMFTRSDPPALAGPIGLRAQVDLLARKDRFLRRLVLRGSFGVSNGRWARPLTQMKVNSLSARARGDKEQVEERTADRVDYVSSQLKGEVTMKGGVASLTRVSFQVPGATATGGGTYDLITKRVNLSGTVSMVADASEATSGFKSFLLKPFDRLFRRDKKKGATLPVSITGKYPRPQYRVVLKR